MTLLSTDHIVPMPALAGWTEEKRTAEMTRIRADIAAQGGVITVERRIRNTAFDDRGQRTSWTFHVKWTD